MTARRLTTGQPIAAGSFRCRHPPIPAPDRRWSTRPPLLHRKGRGNALAFELNTPGPAVAITNPDATAREGRASYMTTNFVDALRANTIEFRGRGTTPLILRGIALSILIISVNTIISAACPVTAFPYDDMFLIDGVWRIVQGQREGTDFYNPIGFGLFHIGAAWWRILGPHRSVLPLTSATFSVFIMLCASIVCARRIWFSVPYYLLICGVLAFETSAPSVYGWSFFAIGTAAFYNRLTTAALPFFFFQLFVKNPSIDVRPFLSEMVILAILL